MGLPHRELSEKSLDFCAGGFFQDARGQKAGAEVAHQSPSSHISRNSSVLDFH